MSAAESLQHAPRFHWDVVAEPDTIDGLGHVSNVEYVRWILAAAQAHSTHCGYDVAAYQRLGHIFVVRRHEVDYLRSALLGDSVRVTTWVDSFRAASCIRKTTLQRTSDGELLARGATTWAFVSIKTGRPGRIPSDLAAPFIGAT